MDSNQPLITHSWQLALHLHLDDETKGFKRVIPFIRYNRVALRWASFFFYVHSLFIFLAISYFFVQLIVTFSFLPFFFFWHAFRNVWVWHLPPLSCSCARQLNELFVVFHLRLTRDSPIVQADAGWAQKVGAGEEMGLRVCQANFVWCV